MSEVTYNFIIDSSEAELAEFKILNLNTAIREGIFCRGDLSWCLQTFLILSKTSTISCILSNRIVPNTINIIHSHQLLKLKGSFSDFIVCVQADYPRREWAHYHLVQNQQQVTINTAYIPHWIQPGITKRNAAQRPNFRVGYAGQTFNGNLAGSPEMWAEMLRPHDIEFVILSDGQWQNLSEVDVLIGIRSFDNKTHNTKPPTKLFNAWHAQIPFIGGWDSAYSQVGLPGEDYLRVSSQEEALAAILRLKKDKRIYNKLVENGLRKAKEYNPNTIAGVWSEVLSGPVMQRYNNWKAHLFYEKLRFSTLEQLGLLKHKSKQFVKQLVKI